MHKIDLVIFDMDGVLLDSEWAHKAAKLRMCTSLGVTAQINLDAFIGYSSWLFWQKFLADFVIQGDADLLTEQQFALVLEEIKKVCQPESQGLTPLLRSLKSEGFRTAIASGSGKSLVHNILDYLGIGDYFDCIVTGNDVANLKPAPDIYIETLRRMGVSASKAIAVEDSQSGCQAAQDAGLFCVGYTNNGENTQDLRKADHLIENLLQLLPKHHDLFRNRCEI